ncbi:hypothetical protein GN244_ATG19889 [Phytophthora infestans]|uniref:Uncharacterized protein n=1 Tax=Phytophthora infestans TaxID=4787 RepID=A0A833S3J2_PHYIN|nr:hypothetical protein GN244_ATG19889 [Phytophthora infestans]KAF4135499.1 hypothetical protein GN958_ATG15298 [Phytophthora infestans]KAF4136072.1 hypothetical protein GN958_ATG14742 [Phytophthora infestans]
MAAKMLHCGRTRYEDLKFFIDQSTELVVFERGSWLRVACGQDVTEHVTHQRRRLLTNQAQFAPN